MFDSLVQKVALYVAERVVEELIEHLPQIIQQVVDTTIEVLPDVYEKIADEVIHRLKSILPFPFNH
jgi:hypothetical protein